jgi:hypothetical protein
MIQTDDDSSPLVALLAQSKASPGDFRSTLPASQHSDLTDFGTAREQIRLEVRQPSFSSLRPLSVVVKGGDVIPSPDTTAGPVLVLDSANADSEVLPIALSFRQASIPNFRPGTLSLSRGGKQDTHPEEEETDPQVTLVKRLQSQNRERWEAMGYAPPQDLIPLVRAASHGNFQRGPTRTAQTQWAPSLAAVSEEPELFETASKAVDLPIGYRFSQLHEKLTVAPVRAVLASGDVESISPYDWPTVRAMLRALQIEVSARVWVEESAYVNDLLALVNHTDRPERVLGFQRDNPDQDLCKLLAKRDGLIEQQKQAELDREFELADTLSILKVNFQKQLEDLAGKFRDPETIKKFDRPNSELIDARFTAQAMLRQNMIEEAAKQAKAVAQLEQRATDRTNRVMRRQFELEQTKLREGYKAKKKQIIEKDETVAEATHNRYQALIDSTNHAVEKLRGQIQGKATSRASQSGHGAKRHSERQSVISRRIDNGTAQGLNLSPPAKIAREGDLKVLNQMTGEFVDGASRPSSRASPRRAH